MDATRILSTYEVSHRHGGNEWTPMREHHDPAEHDPERGWLRGKRIFRCDCGDEIAITLPENDEEQRR